MSLTVTVICSAFFQVHALTLLGKPPNRDTCHQHLHTFLRGPSLSSILCSRRLPTVSSSASYYSLLLHIFFFYSFVSRYLYVTKRSKHLLQFQYYILVSTYHSVYGSVCSNKRMHLHSIQLSFIHFCYVISMLRCRIISNNTALYMVAALQRFRCLIDNAPLLIAIGISHPFRIFPLYYTYLSVPHLILL